MVTSACGATSASHSPATFQRFELVKLVDDIIRSLEHQATHLHADSIKRCEDQAAAYETVDEQGASLTSGFKKYVAAVYRRTFRPTPFLKRVSLASFLELRVKQTMLHRWRRLSYNREHADELVARAQELVAEQERSYGDTLASTCADTNNGPSPHSARRLSIVGTRGGVQKVELNPCRAPVDSGARKSWLSFPQPPVVLEGAELFVCPFCGTPRTTLFLQEREWQ